MIVKNNNSVRQVVKGDCGQAARVGASGSEVVVGRRGQAVVLVRVVMEARQ